MTFMRLHIEQYKAFSKENQSCNLSKTIGIRQPNTNGASFAKNLPFRDCKQQKKVSKET